MTSCTAHGLINCKCREPLHVYQSRQMEAELPRPVLPPDAARVPQGAQREPARPGLVVDQVR